MSIHTVTIGETTFDDIRLGRQAAGRRADLGSSGGPRRFARTPGGHIIAITLLDAKLLLDRGDV